MAAEMASEKIQKAQGIWEGVFDLEQACKTHGWEEDDVIVGIDEAGRGPALGAMVYGAAWCRVGDHGEVVKSGVADSKQLSEEQRETSFRKLKESPGVHSAVREITAEEISAQQLGRAPRSLNKISHAAQIELLNGVRKTVTGGEGEGKRQRRGRLVALFVDVVGPQNYHHETLSRVFPECLVIVQSKADAKFPITSAASVVAKVTRDRGLREHVFPEPLTNTPSKAYGSGYPSDPATGQWLRQNIHKVFLFPRLARFDWDPVKKAEVKSCVAMRWTAETPESEAKRWQYFQEMWSVSAADF